MAAGGVVKYECDICEERGFKSRADWLFHLILDRHSLKARESMQKLYLSSNGNLFVISGIGEVDNSLILDYVGVKIRSFSNFVSFRPEANVCIMVCDEGDFASFAAMPHVIGGVQPRFRNYNEIPPTEWKSYFDQTQVKKEAPDPDLQQGGISNASSSSTSVNSGKRKEDETTTTGPSGGSSDYGRKVPKLEPNLEGGSTETPMPSNKVMDELDNFIMMPEPGRSARLKAIAGLKQRLRDSYLNCELINVGADFLGFNLDREEMTIFFDWNGLTNPANSHRGQVHTVVETDITNVKTRVLNVLKLPEANGSVSEVKCEGDTIKLTYLVEGQIRLKCTLLFRPFKLALTTLLCKKLFFTDSQSMLLVKMVVYWAVNQESLAGAGFHYGYAMYWLVYFYLMQQEGGKPVIELQRSCNYQIVDQGMNVAFSYDANLISQLAMRGSTSQPDGETEVQMVLGWFRYMVMTFGNARAKGVSRCHSLLCPRFGVVIDKIMFRVCKPQNKQPIQTHWVEDLKSFGFDKSMWAKLGRLELPSTLCIQHPFYIDENISLAFTGKFSKYLFKAMRKTKNYLTQLLKGQRMGSVLTMLSIDYRAKAGMKLKPGKANKAGGNESSSNSEDEADDADGGSECEENATMDSEDDDDDAESVPVDIKMPDINATLSALHPSNYHRWDNEITGMLQSITLSEADRYLRTAVIGHLNTLLRQQYPFCELIPVGADFLGFNIEGSVFNVYFDSRGATNPRNPSRKRTIVELDNPTRTLQETVFSTLKYNEGVNGPITVRGVATKPVTKKDKGTTTINFVSIVHGHGQLSCTLFLRPFELAETALLCKQIVWSNPQTMNFVAMIIYWTKLRNDLTGYYLPNPFVIFWLVHFFLTQKNILPPLLDLQKACNYEILVENVNVAFYFDPKILNPMFSQVNLLAGNVKQNVELLIEWFMYIDSALGGLSVKRNFVICPRLGQLVNKKQFKPKPNKRARYGNAAKILPVLDFGYDQAMTNAVRKFRLRDNLCIQHPFFVSDNMAKMIKGPECRSLFEAIKQTKDKLAQLLFEATTQPDVSLGEALYP